MPPVKTPSVLTENLSCPHPFLREKTSFVHAIEVHAAGKIRSAVIGVTVADPLARSLSCAIVTAEGMVLFEAEEMGGLLNVRRAMPPFDAEDFAGSMLADIKLLFFAPEGTIHKRGVLPDGKFVCRWKELEGDWVDVFGDCNEVIQIKRYSPCGSLKRHVIYDNLAGIYFQSIVLHAKETPTYSLYMTLIEAQSVRN